MKRLNADQVKKRFKTLASKALETGEGYEVITEKGVLIVYPIQSFSDELLNLVEKDRQRLFDSDETQYLLSIPGMKKKLIEGRDED